MRAFRAPGKTYTRLHAQMARGNPHPGNPGGGASIANVANTLRHLVRVVELGPSRFGNSSLRQVNVSNVRAVISGLEQIDATGGPDKYARAADLMDKWPIEGTSAPDADVGVV